jgi:hypothetical protein
MIEKIDYPGEVTEDARREKRKADVGLICIAACPRPKGASAVIRMLSLIGYQLSTIRHSTENELSKVKKTKSVRRS